MKIDSNIWDVTVQADNPVDFTHTFVEPGPGGFGEYPIKGRPIAGRKALHILCTTRKSACHK